MINHARTLLLNESSDFSSVGKQYIGPDFSPVPLSGGLADVRNLLIRPGWPRDYRNYAATLLASILQDSPFQKLVDAVDSRRSFDSGSLTRQDFVSTISMNRRHNASSMQVVGSFVPDVHSGIFSNVWTISYLDAGFVIVSSQRSMSSITASVSFSGDASGICLLDPGNQLGIQFVGVSAVPLGLMAEVSASTSMSYDLMSAMNRLWSSDSAGSIFTTGKHPSLPELGEVFNSSSRPDQSLAAIIAAYVLSL